MKFGIVGAVALLASLIVSVSPAAATSDCQAWDGGTYDGSTTTNLMTQNATQGMGTNPNRLFGIRFKVPSPVNNPTFVGWKFYASGQGMQYSFYLHHWSDNALMPHYLEHITGIGTTTVGLDPANYMALTPNDEYIASVYVFQSGTTMDLTVPIVYPTGAGHEVVTSGNAWYSASGTTNWPHPNWANADPSLSNSWGLSPIVCSG